MIHMHVDLHHSVQKEIIMIRLHMEYLPHMRVGEFWWNFKMWCSLKEPDLFYVEDDQILEYMEEFCKEESEKWIRSNE